MTTPLLYVAGAYSGDVEKNIQIAEQASINLIRNGFHVITPHKNTAGYEWYEDERLTYNTWLEMDLNILSRCDGVYVLKNWVASKGAKQEIAEAHRLNKPVVFERQHPSEVYSVGDFLRMFFGGKK